MRLVGVNGASVIGEFVGEREPGMPGGEQDVTEDAVSVELEAAGDGAYPLDSRRAETLVPAVPLAQLRDMARGTPATVGR